MAKNPIFPLTYSVRYMMLSRVKNEKKWHFFAIQFRLQRIIEP